MLWVLQHCVRRLPIRTCVCTYAANAGAFLDLNTTENKEHIVKKLKKTDYVIIAVLAALIACAAAWIVLGREKSGGTVRADEPEKTVSYEDYNGKRIGIITGSSFEQIAKNKFPDSECFYFNNYTDMAAALAQSPTKSTPLHLQRTTPKRRDCASSSTRCWQSSAKTARCRR